MKGVFDRVQPYEGRVRVTPEVTGLPSLLSLYRQRIMKSKVKIRVPVHPMSVF